MMGFAVAAVGVVMVLVLARPRIGRWTIDPPHAVLAGISVLATGGFVRPADIVDAASSLWPALVGVGSMMVLTAACARAGTLDLFATAVEARAGSSAWMLFTVVFVGSFVTAGVLNNDAAVVVNTTLVASLLRRRFAAQQDVAEPFLLAAFLGAGVAPLVISNPMNLTVSHLAGIDFLVYARFMVPVSLCGALVTFVVLAAIYRRVLTAVASPPTSSLVRSSRDARRGLFLLASALGGYAVCAMVHVPTWPVSLGAALLAFAWIVHSEGPRAGRTLLREDVAWHVLAVLPIVFVFAAGLTRSGAIDALVPVLRHAGALKIGLSSAVGSALLNNHTMALINVAALVPGAGVREVFAALIGGDLGPRFVPFGSLAGLLWLETLRQQGVHVGFGRFVQIGILTGLPTLLVCLMILRMLPG